MPIPRTAISSLTNEKFVTYVKKHTVKIQDPQSPGGGPNEMSAYQTPSTIRLSENFGEVIALHGIQRLFVESYISLSFSGTQTSLSGRFRSDIILSDRRKKVGAATKFIRLGLLYKLTHPVGEQNERRQPYQTVGYKSKARLQSISQRGPKLLRVRSCTGPKRLSPS